MRKKTGIMFVICMGVMIFLMMLPLAFAEPVLISIVISDTCKKSLFCMGYDELVTLDTSDPLKSGKFEVDANGNTYRGKPYYKNHWSFYKYSKEPAIIFIDPDIPTQIRSKTITIESSSSMTWINRADNIIKNNTFYAYQNRSVVECSKATIISDLSLLQDTIDLFASDCKIPSKYNNTIKTVKPVTKHKDCSWACMKEKWMKNAKDEAKKGFGINPNIKLKKSNDKVRVN